MFTPAKFRQFEKAYAKAVEKHGDDRDAVFVFEGDEYLIKYAMYMIEYLKGQFA